MMRNFILLLTLLSALVNCLEEKEKSTVQSCDPVLGGEDCAAYPFEVC